MAATPLVSAAEVALRDVKKPAPESKRLWKIKSSIWSLPWKQMANRHGAQSGFHPSPSRRQPLGPGDVPQEQLWTHTHGGAGCVLPGRDSVVRPCHILLSRQEVMPPPQVDSLHQGSSKGIFFPSGAGFFHVVPRLLQASQSAGTATPGCLTQTTPQSLSPTCPGLSRSLSSWRGQGSAQGQHCTSLNLALWPWHSWSHHLRD